MLLVKVLAGALLGKESASIAQFSFLLTTFLSDRPTNENLERMCWHRGFDAVRRASVLGSHT